MKKVFLSFASSDGLNAKVLTRLKQQQLEVWDFQTRNGALKAGTRLNDAIRSKVAEADLFAILVTEAALQSEWVRAELDCAFERRQIEPRFAILPIIDRSLLDAQQLHPWLHELHDTLACYVSSRSYVSIEDAIEQICKHVGVERVPPISEDPRLPFMERLYGELQHYAASAAYPSEAYQRVERLAVEFLGAFDAGQHEQAEHVIGYLLATLKHEYAHALHFYPIIVRAVNLVMLERHADALDALLGLRTRMGTCAADDERYPKEYLPAVLGAVYFQMGEFRWAREEYQKAWELNPRDATRIMALLLARLRCGDENGIDVTAILAQIPLGGLEPEDAEELAINSAFALGFAGDIKEALRRLRRLVGQRFHRNWLVACCRRPKPADSASRLRRGIEIVTGYADLLLADNQPNRARQLLEFGLKEFSAPPDILAALGDVCLVLRDPVAATKHFLRLGEMTERHWNHQYVAMRGLLQANEFAGAAAIAGRILDLKTHGAPKKPTEFFIAGAANWILGHGERARYDLERSNEPDFTYAKYLGPCGSALVGLHASI